MAKVSLRVPDADLEEIDRRADAAGLTRSAYVVRTVLGLATSDEQRFERLEDRIAELERAKDLGAFR